jgi:AcrR family transcriptional regulator
MQRIAREVGVTTMALYRYFSSKAELVDLMIDSAGGPRPAVAANPGGWRSRLAEWTLRCSAIYTKHPWFLEATAVARRTMGPNELAWLDEALGILADTGLPARERHMAFLLLMGHVRSNAAFAASAAKDAPAGVWVSELTDRLLERRDEYPSLLAAIDSGAFVQPSEQSLEFGLACILNGIETLIRIPNDSSQ